MATGTAAGLERGDKLRYRLLGGIGVERDGEAVDLGGRKQRAVLAALLVDVGRVVPVEQLMDRVWGDAVPGQATASLQAYVSNLRRLLDPDRASGGRAAGVIVTEAGGYRIYVDRDQLDLARFEDLRDDGLAALAAGDPAKAADCLDAGLAVFGPVLPELADPGAERFEFHVAATATLRTTSRPLLLVVDDLQWADPSSLRLLEFLAGELRTMPVFLVVTVRPLGAEPAPALVACLAELARHSTVRRLELTGLGSAEVEAWLSRRADGASIRLSSPWSTSAPTATRSS